MEPSPASAIAVNEPAATQIDNSSVRPDAECKALMPRFRELAYRLYEDHGRVDGYQLEDWIEAESIIRQGGKIAVREAD